MSKRLLIITQKVDDSDDLLGFFVTWIRAFSEHFERVDVIALGVGSYELPAHVRVHSLGKERSVSKFFQALYMVKFLWRYTPRGGSVFAHMSPAFAIVAWPLAVLRQSHLVLWYLHRSVTMRLRLAVALSDSVVTADAKSLILNNQKIISVGHGIDSGRFTIMRDWSALSGRALRILSVGRLSPIKDFATLIHAVALLRERDISVEVRIVGRAVMSTDHAYAGELQELVARLGVQDSVHFVGFVPYRDIDQQYAWADVVVGCTPRGGIDKALLEAMAAGCVTLTSNTVMAPYLAPYDRQLVFMHGDSESLATKIQSLADWNAISVAMVASVREHHNISATIAKISTLL